MKHTSVPFDKKLYKLDQKNFRQGRAHSEAFQLATQVGVPLLGMLANTYMEGRHKDERLKAIQSMYQGGGGSGDAGGGDLPPMTPEMMSQLAESPTGPEALLHGMMGARAQRQKQQQDLTLAAVKAQYDDENDQRTLDRQLALAEKNSNMTLDRDKAKAVFEATLKAQNRVPVNVPHGSPASAVYGDQVSVDPADISAIGNSISNLNNPHTGSGGVPSFTPEETDALHAEGQKHGMAPAFVDAQIKSNPKGMRALLDAGLRQERDTALGKQKSESQKQGFFARFLGLGAQAQTQDPTNIDKTIDPEKAGGAARGLMNQLPQVTAPDPGVPAPQGGTMYQPLPEMSPGAEYGGAPQGGGNPIPKDIIDSYNNSTPQIQAQTRALLGKKGYDLSSLGSQAATPQIAPQVAPQPQAMTAPPPVQPQAPPAASQPTGYGQPMQTPQQPIFAPHEMTAIYTAAQQHGVQPQQVDAEIAQNPWGVRNALDSQMSALRGAPSYAPGSA